MAAGINGAAAEIVARDQPHLCAKSTASVTANAEDAEGQAQPGAGKTALVAGYLEARKRGGIWYQVDAGDADPASFIYHLGLAARATRAAAELPLLASEYMEDLPGFARRFFRARFAGLGSGAALVLAARPTLDFVASYRIKGQNASLSPVRRDGGLTT